MFRLVLFFEFGFDVLRFGLIWFFHFLWRLFIRASGHGHIKSWSCGKRLSRCCLLPRTQVSLPEAFRKGRAGQVGTRRRYPCQVSYTRAYRYTVDRGYALLVYSISLKTIDCSLVNDFVTTDGSQRVV